MNRREVTAILGFFIAVITLLFGDNIYQQITGRSFYSSRDVQSSEPTPAAEIRPNSNTSVVPLQPTSLGLLHIPGSREEGIRFTASRKGRYIFSYAGGAYSPWPEAQPAQARWRTGIGVYKNRPIEWVQRPHGPEDDKSFIYKEPSNPDGFIGNYDVTTQSRAISVAQSMPNLQFDLRALDYLLFVAIDDQGWYSNPAPNIGEVIFEVSFIPD